MNIKTKYKINDWLYPIKKGGYNEFIKCETCTGSGRVCINNTERTVSCPDCYGRRGRREWQDGKWFVCIESASKVGKIATETNRKNLSEKDRITYMIDNTGIGSGTLWNENSLFPSEKEAQAECDKKNKIDLIDETPPQNRTQGVNA